MADVALEMHGVSKKFRKGEMYDSLRDLLPALGSRLVTKGSKSILNAKEFWALSDVSFQVMQGEAFGVIGGNGAGKSTMLKLLSGILKPTSGRITAYGRLSALIEVGAGFHPDLTGRDNIYLNGTILGMRREEIRKKFEAIVEFSGLADFIDTPVKRYSSGMYARLGFSVAAHVEPDVLIIDEVLSVGDYFFQQKCLEKMTSVIKGGATVIFVSHNLRAVSELCKRSLLLERGKIVKEGNTGEVISAYMTRSLNPSPGGEDKDVYISMVRIRRDGPMETIQFESGELAFVDIEITANKWCERLAVVLDVKDENFYNVFDTSTERLGESNFSIEKGQTYTCTFQVTMNFGRGTFYFGTTLYRYDIQREFDTRFPAATVFISTERDVRGAVNLKPQVVHMGVKGPAS